MAEPVPIKELLARAIKARLEGVTAAKGYQVTIARVDRPAHPERWQPANMAVRMLMDDPARLPDEDEGTYPRKIAWRQEYLLDVCVILPGDSAESLDARVTLIEAEVTRAFMAEPTFGGLANLGSEMGPGEYLSKAGTGFDGVTLVLAASYRVWETDPYKKA